MTVVFRQEIDQSTGFLVGIKVNSAEFQDYGLGMDDAKAIAGMVEVRLIQSMFELSFE